MILSLLLVEVLEMFLDIWWESYGLYYDKEAVVAYRI